MAGGVPQEMEGSTANSAAGTTAAAGLTSSARIAR